MRSSSLMLFSFWLSGSSGTYSGFNYEIINLYFIDLSFSKSHMLATDEGVKLDDGNDFIVNIGHHGLTNV